MTLYWYMYVRQSGVLLGISAGTNRNQSMRKATIGRASCVLAAKRTVNLRLHRLFRLL